MMSKQVERSCELCNKAVLWYPWSIEKHLKSHGWTPAGFYYMKVAPPNWVGNKAGSGGSEGYQDGEKVEDFHKWKASGCQAECQVRIELFYLYWGVTRSFWSCCSNALFFSSICLDGKIRFISTKSS